MHWFYIGFCIVFQIASWSIFSVSAYQLYIDRENFRAASRSPTSLRTRSVFRLSTFVGSFILAVTSVDFYGAFGIYPPYVRVTLMAVSILPLTVAVTVACVREILAGLCLLSAKQQAWKSFVLLIVPFHTGLAQLLTILSYYIESRALFVVNRVSAAWAAIVMAFSINIVYYALRRHQRTMKSSDIEMYSPTNWANVLRNWRVYSVSMSACVFAFVAGFAIQLFSEDGSMLSRHNVNFEVDTDRPPGTIPLMEPALELVIYIILTWRAYVGLQKDVASSSNRKSPSTKLTPKVGVEHAHSQLRSIPLASTSSRADEADVHVVVEGSGVIDSSNQAGEQIESSPVDILVKGPSSSQHI